MTYNQIIQKAGKRITKHVYYFNDNNVRTNVLDEEVDRVKFTTSTPLVGTSIKGCEITLKSKISGRIYVDIEAKYGTDTATETFGPYYLKEEPTYDANKKTYLHKTYDKLLKSMVDYTALNIAYPCTIYQYFVALTTSLGYTNNIVSLPNGSIQMTSDVFDGIDFTYRDVLDDIAKANGVVFYMDGNEIKIGELDDNNSITINDDILKNQNIEFGEHFGPINVIVLSRSGDTDKIYYPENLPSEIHEFKISDSQLMNDNNRSDFLPALYNQLNGIEYDIYDTELVGYGKIVPMQKVVFSTGGKTYNSYIFDEEITLTTGYKQAVFNEMPEESSTDYKSSNTTDKGLKQAYILVDKQNTEIQLVAEEVGEIAASVSGESTNGVLNLNEVKNCEPISIRIRPLGTSISYLYPSNNLYPSSDLYMPDRRIRFYNNTKNKDTFHEIPADLLYYDSETYDEYILDYANKTCRVYKKCGYDASGNVVVLDTPQILNFNYPFISLEDGNYTITLLGYDNAYMYVDLIKSTKYSSQNASKSEIKLTPRTISIETSDNKTSAGIKIHLYNEDGTELSNDQGNIEMTGLVSFNDLTGTGRTEINGSNITTGSIDANLITTGTIDASQVNVTNINANNITSGNIQSANYVANTSGTKIDLTNGTIDTKNFKVAANGTITGSLNGQNIDISNINASNINSGTLNLATGSGAVKFGQGTTHLQTTGLNLGIDGVNAGIDVGDSGLSNCSTINSKKGISFEILEQGYGLGYFTFSSRTAHINMLEIYNHVHGSSSKNIKEKIKVLSNEEREKIYNTIKNLTLYSYNYKKEYSETKDGKYYGFMLEDLENTEINDIIHIKQDENDKNIKTFETAELSKLNMILIQELQNKIEKLEERISQLENKESEK